VDLEAVEVAVGEGDFNIGIGVVRRLVGQGLHSWQLF